MNPHFEPSPIQYTGEPHVSHGSPAGPPLEILQESSSSCCHSNKSLTLCSSITPPLYQKYPTSTLRTNFDICLLFPSVGRGTWMRGSETIRTLRKREPTAALSRSICMNGMTQSSQIPSWGTSKMMVERAGHGRPSRCKGAPAVLLARGESRWKMFFIVASLQESMTRVWRFVERSKTWEIESEHRPLPDVSGHS